MRLIAGLGNPGEQYARTPHNAGFDVLDILCANLGGRWSDSFKFRARLAKVTERNETVLLAQPQTYMNASGNSVASLVRYYKMDPTEVIAVSDDADLPAGRLRIRAGGGAGGHRGLQSLIQSLGTSDFTRVKVGVGRGAHAGAELVSHVLGRLAPEEQVRFDKAVPAAADAVLTILRQGLAAAMNKYNPFNAEPPVSDAAGQAEADCKLEKQRISYVEEV